MSAARLATVEKPTAADAARELLEATRARDSAGERWRQIAREVVSAQERVDRARQALAGAEGWPEAQAVAVRVGQSVYAVTRTGQVVTVGRAGE